MAFKCCYHDIIFFFKKRPDIVNSGSLYVTFWNKTNGKNTIKPVKNGTQ